MTPGGLRGRVYYRLMRLFGMGRVNRFLWLHVASFRSWWGAW